MKKSIVALASLLIILLILGVFCKESTRLILLGGKASHTDMEYRGFFEQYSQAIFESDIMKIDVLTGSSSESEMVCEKDGSIRKFEVELGEIYENGKFQLLIKSTEGKIECVYYGRIEDQEWTKCSLELDKPYRDNSFFGELEKFTLRKVIDKPIMAIQQYFRKTFIKSNGDENGYYNIEQIYYDVIEKNESSEKVKVDGVLIHYNKDGKIDGEQKVYNKVFDVRYEEDKHEIYDENGEFVYLTYIQDL